MLPHHQPTAAPRGRQFIPGTVWPTPLPLGGMNAQHAPWPDRARGASVSDGLASVLPLPLLNAVENTARSASRRGSDGGGDSDGEAGNDTNDTNDEDVTLLLLAEHHRPGEGYFTRALGVNSAMSVAETVRAVLIAFSWPGAVRMLQDAGDTVVGGAVSGSAAMRPTTASAASSAASSRDFSTDGVAWAVRATAATTCGSTVAPPPRSPPHFGRHWDAMAQPRSSPTVQCSASPPPAP